MNINMIFAIASVSVMQMMCMDVAVAKGSSHSYKHSSRHMSSAVSHPSSTVPTAMLMTTAVVAAMHSDALQESEVEYNQGQAAQADAAMDFFIFMSSAMGLFVLAWIMYGAITHQIKIRKEKRELQQLAEKNRAYEFEYHP